MNKANLVSGLKNLLHHKELQGAVCSLVVKDDKNNTLLAYNPGLFMVPASTMKLIATSTAMHLLGADYRFHTGIYYTGSIDAGKITGDLIIKGFGDPTLGSGYFDETAPLLCFEKITQILKTHAVQQVEGNIIIDSSFIGNKHSYQDWSLEDYPWYYGALPQALNFIDNCFPVRQSGGKVIIEDTPGVDSRLLRDEFDVSLEKDLKEITAIGCPACSKKSLFIDAGLDPSKYKQEKLSLSNPSMVFKESLQAYLGTKNIKINAQHKTTGNAERYDLGTITSPPLSDIVKQTHFDSINLFAECITIAVQKAFDEKKENFNNYWQNTIGNSKFNACDGSGLSRKNLVTAAFLAELMVFNLQDKGGAFIKTLPLLGAEGTVKNYGKGLQAKNTVRLKTGSMGKVRSFAGVAEGTEKVAFAMIFNNYECSEGEMRNLCNEMLKELAMA